MKDIQDENVKFDLDAIESTMASYKKNNIYEGVVISKRNDGVIFNIGGKDDAFIEKSDFENYDDVKIGERFKVVVLGYKNDEGMPVVSKSQAQDIIQGALTVDSLKIGSDFSFFVTNVTKNGDIQGKLGLYTIVVPREEKDAKVHNPLTYLNKQVKCIVTEIDTDKKRIVGSIRILTDQIRENAEITFWSSAFINKIVEGTVEKIMPYGAFIDLDGVPAFMHISDASWQRVNNLNDIISVGERYSFRIVKIDRENKKVSVGLKQNTQDPKFALMNDLKFSEVYDATVVKLLPFGAIVRLENGLEGLLHINDCTEDRTKRIYELVKVDDKIKVALKDYDREKQRVSFKLL